MANLVYIATSLDGYIATKNGGLDWLHDIPNPENSDFGYSQFYDRIDALIMGRNTFEKVISFSEWPYNKPVFVLSNRLDKVCDRGDRKIEIVNGNLHNLCERLKNLGYANLYIDGGATIQSFLQEDLIDELIITRIPIIIGDGFPLFRCLDRALKFVHIHTEIYNNMLVKSHYTRQRF